MFREVRGGYEVDVLVHGILHVITAGAVAQGEKEARHRAGGGGLG